LFLDLYHFIYSFDFSAVKQDLFGAVYENYLKELYKDDDTKKGQVFTPPEIVEFMLDEVGYTVDYVQQTIIANLPSLKDHLEDRSYNIDGLSLIDPACGSGTFLYKSAGRIVNALYNIRKANTISDSEAGKIAELLICNNIVGFDIEPFPLYLAEMNILQSLLFFNVSADGSVLNPIDTQIKIFSTDDSIAEFHNLESSMEKDLQDLIN
jgi:type I restriction-modification system DNA methylase subunit